MLSKLIQKQQRLTLDQLKKRREEGEKQRKYIQGLISRNRELKTRAFTVREYDHLINKNQAIKTKIDKAVKFREVSNSPELTHPKIIEPEPSPCYEDEKFEEEVQVSSEVAKQQSRKSGSKSPEAPHKIVTYDELAPLIKQYRHLEEKAEETRIVPADSNHSTPRKRTPRGMLQELLDKKALKHKLKGLSVQQQENVLEAARQRFKRKQ